MSTHKLRLALAFIAAFMPGIAVAQQQAGRAGAPQASAEMVQCARAQAVVDNIIAAAMARLESARQTNSPTEMRATMDQLEAALRDIRAQLTPCATAAPADPHAGHTMPGVQPAPVAPAPGNQTPADPHAGHVSGQQSEKQRDPVNGLMVDPANSPKTTYQGQTYYFSSEQSRKKFLENPAQFAKKPKG